MNEVEHNLDRQTERNYGIDALRIVSMLMIVSLHVVGLGGITGSTPLFSLNHQVAWYIYVFTNCGVNCYALISGYVGVYTKHKYSNIIELWLRVVLINLIITGIFCIIFPEKVSIMSWVHAIFPVYYEQYWYFSSYFALFFFIPILNTALNKLSSNQIRAIIGLLLLVFSIIPTVLYKMPFMMNGGSSAWWLMVVYLVGGYIRKYNIGKQIKTYIWVVLLFASSSMAWLSCLLIDLFTTHVFGISKYEDYLLSNSSPFTLFSAVCLLLVFSRLRLKIKTIKIVEFFAPMTFSVYLIHCQKLIRINLLEDAFCGFSNYSVWVMLLLIVLSSIAIYLVCSCLDWVRYYLFMKIKLKDKLLRIENRVIDKVMKTANNTN